ncbi:polyglutamine-binding protein 1 isoform X1 [Neodiprion pinetum]|uniref:Polyglutamine-binding protein 1 n=1 Tax=Neodiprion lecontei TaxID=441921 RepID=A0ABM3GKB7_NEOLC|nr:polyglutamine-binding protein 1 isoform X1 [Neodiprion pinetum]XP_046600718.1 polyglutamine-binding protein 1 isoform X1 [Neodiprion lecontei]
MSRKEIDCTPKQYLFSLLDSQLNRKVALSLIQRLTSTTCTKYLLNHKAKINSKTRVVAWDTALPFNRCHLFKDACGPHLRLGLGYSSCPNKYNIYHECNSKCKELWGSGRLQPTEKYIKRQIRLLLKYPLPDTWKAVFDPGSGQHYYWEWSSDLVSWYPPGHPKCQISQPASQLREELHLKAADQDDNLSSDESTSDQEPMEIDEAEAKREQKLEIIDRYMGFDNRRVQRHESAKEKKDRSLDPMDPASYSDIPRGKWSDGLARHNEAKTGADTTASGPLYQMRPYPSPGAVLRSNKVTKLESESLNKPKVFFPEKSE